MNTNIEEILEGFRDKFYDEIVEVANSDDGGFAYPDTQKMQTFISSIFLAGQQSIIEEMKARAPKNSKRVNQKKYPDITQRAVLVDDYWVDGFNSCNFLWKQNLEDINNNLKK